MFAASLTGQAISHYRVDQLLASGGMGDVYRGTDLRLGRRVALKFLGGVADSARRRRLLHEAQAAAQLDHPNICTVFEVDESPGGAIFIAMAYYEGETLDRILARGPVALPRALSLALQAGRGLAAAHDELIVHRDIKPANLVITRGDTVKILDFGIATAPGDAAAEPGFVEGTPAYMSPERLRNEAVDQRADIWSLGAVLYELVTGTPPFQGATLEALAASIMGREPVPASARQPGLPARLDEIIGTALAKSPAQRYQRVDAMVRHLAEFQASLDPDSPTRRFPAVGARTSIAVLPFADMTAAHDQEYLCDGLAEEILRALSRIAEFDVTSRTSSFQFKRQLADVREIGGRLNVDFVVEGSVRRAGDRIRIAAQVVNVLDGYCAWYERFDRTMQDIFAVQDEIADQIAAALIGPLTAPKRPSPPAAGGEVYELYLQGRQFIHQHRRKAFDVALHIFARAIELDPAFARAYAGIADCHSFLRLYFGGGDASIRAADEASAHALALAPDLADACASRGLALMLRGQPAEAEEHLRRALALEPRLYDPHYVYGRLCFTLGRLEDAAGHYRDACALVPEAFDAWYLLGMCYRRLGDAPRARATSFECIEAVKRRVRSHPDDTRAWTMGASVLAEMGEPEKAAAWIARALAIDPEESIIRYNAACVYAGIGRPDEAFESLEAALRLGALSKGWAQNDPDLDPLRGDERFDRLMAATTTGDPASDGRTGPGTTA
jgi:serine/threonine protein kinase/tetratricopeptide (TPR) repeat protein